MQNLPGELGWASHTEVTVQRYRSGMSSTETDSVIEEAPVALMYNGQAHVVMLATPLDLEDFALGFSLTEGIVDRIEQVHAIRVFMRSEGIEVRMRIADSCASNLGHRERNLTGRTGCGLCGSKTLAQALKVPRPVNARFELVKGQLGQAMHSLQERQPLNTLTGAIHAAAWFSLDNTQIVVREDVGRHNALDKLIGYLLRMKIDTQTGYVVVTSRASYEMVQKTTAAGISLLAAISAPTGLAIRLAEKTGLTLAGFVRGHDHVVYSHPFRLPYLKGTSTCM